MSSPSPSDFDRRHRCRSLRDSGSTPSAGGSTGSVRRNGLQRFMRPVGDPAGRASTLDLLLSGMAGAGHGVAALSFYLGLDEAEVRERAASLGLAEPAEKPLRRPTSANPWSVEDVRLLIALWLDNVSAASIAATLGRSPSSIHGKRRWLGLGVRDRKRLQERPVAQCRATALPWKPTFDVSAIVARLISPRPGILPVVPRDRSARAVPGRGQMGAWPGQGKGRAVFGSRLRGLKSPGDRRAHAGRVRRAADGSRRSTIEFRACRSFANVAT